MFVRPILWLWLSFVLGGSSAYQYQLLLSASGSAPTRADQPVANPFDELNVFNGVALKPPILIPAEGTMANPWSLEDVTNLQERYEQIRDVWSRAALAKFGPGVLTATPRSSTSTSDEWGAFVEFVPFRRFRELVVPGGGGQATRPRFGRRSKRRLVPRGQGRANVEYIFSS